MNLNGDKMQLIPDPEDMSSFRKANGFIYFAGQVGIDESGRIPNDPEEQIDVAYHNVEQALKDAGITVEHVIKVNHYIADRKYLPLVINKRKQFFRKPYPASTGLICGIAIPELIYEIEMVAVEQLD